MFLSVKDLERLGATALQEFNLGVQARSSRSSELDIATQRLEAKLEQLYALAATLAQREETLEGVAQIWSGMVSICDRVAQPLSELNRGIGFRSESFDRILDIRSACEENRALHA